MTQQLTNLFMRKYLILKYSLPSRRIIFLRLLKRKEISIDQHADPPTSLRAITILILYTRLPHKQVCQLLCR